MSQMTYPKNMQRHPGEEWQTGTMSRDLFEEDQGPSWGLLLAGIGLVGLGFMAWQVIAPDLRRYMKIKSM